MSDTAIWEHEAPAQDAVENSSALRRPIIVLASVLGVSLGVALLVYFKGASPAALLAAHGGASVTAHHTSMNSVLSRQLDHWPFRVVLATEAGCAALLAALLVVMVSWRRDWERRVQAMSEAAGRKAAELERQLRESQRAGKQLQGLRAEAQQRAAGLEDANARLHAEFDRLKKAEKNLAQERQALESSKAVLEVHVQARTKELELLRRRYELILNSAGEGICGLDAEGRTTFANPAAVELTGWPLQELIGKTEQQIFGQNGSGNAALAADHASEERVLCRRDGASFTVECVRTPITENGCVVGSVLVFKDITERKRVEETLARQAAELARSNTELEQFAFVASHDLQEPLRKILAFGDRLKTKCEGVLAAEALDYLERMQGAAGRMRRLIDDLLAFSRVMRSAEPFAPVNLAATAREVLSDLEVRIEKSGARVEVGDLPVIEADAMQIRQLLLNLIGNGLKFQPPGAAPVVKVQARLVKRESPGDTIFARKPPAPGDPGPAGDQLCEISVQDNGIGFDEQYTEKIFAVFQRLHGRNEYEGTGVGLAVCRRITERHQGSIVAQSKPGQGATFVVTLPVRRPKAQVVP